MPDSNGAVSVALPGVGTPPTPAPVSEGVRLSRQTATEVAAFFTELTARGMRRSEAQHLTGMYLLEVMSRRKV